MPNPDGVNGWQGFGTEEPYGQATKEKALADAAPLASGKLTVGALNAPKRAQRQTQQQPVLAHPATQPGPPPAASRPMSVVDVWQQIAATPGASGLAQMMAAKAAR